MINGSGVNLEYFKKTNLPKRNITFLLIARLLKSKGIYEFVNAAKLIKKKYKKVNFIIVGGFEKTTDSISFDDLKKWTDTNVIEWHDHVLDVRPYIRNSHIYVLPSYREGTPRTVLEAMAIGRPIITTNVAGCRHLINKNGFLVQPKSIKALKVVMERFINEHHIIPMMAEASYKIAKKKYDVIKINKVLLNEMNL